LATVVQQNFKLDPFSNSLFLFCGRKCNRLKALYWEGDGFILLYKRIESGAFQCPRTQAEVLEISHQEFRWLLEGLSISQPKAVRKTAIKKVI
jgi:transposase